MNFPKKKRRVEALLFSLSIVSLFRPNVYKQRIVGLIAIVINEIETDHFVGYAACRSRNCIVDVGVTARIGMVLLDCGGIFYFFSRCSKSVFALWFTVSRISPQTRLSTAMVTSVTLRMNEGTL